MLLRTLPVGKMSAMHKTGFESLDERLPWQANLPSRTPSLTHFNIAKWKSFHEKYFPEIEIRRVAFFRLGLPSDESDQSKQPATLLVFPPDD